MIEKDPADSAALAVRGNAQEADFVHIQPGNARDPGVGFVNRQIE